MDEEEAVKNVTWMTGKKSKSKSEKGEKNEEGSMGIQEVQSISAVEVTEYVQISGKEDIVEMKRDKKKLKKKKNEESKVAEADIKKGTEEESTVVYGEDGSGVAMVNVKKKRKKREKNKNMDKRFENKSKKNLVGERISAMKSTEDASKERKKHKSKRKREFGDFEEGEKVGKEVGQHSRNCDVNATEIAEKKKMKKEKKESKDYNWCQGTSVEANHDGGDLLSLQQEIVADNVEGNIESAKHDGNATKKLERKKKKKNKKKKHNKDNSSVAQQDNNVDNDNNGLVNTDEIQSSEVEYASKKKKKKIILMENGSDDLRDNVVEFEKKGKIKEMKSVENGSNAPTPNKSSKKVRFSGQVEVFPIPGNSNKVKDNVKDNLIRGMRFTPEEDEIVKEAVFDYIQIHDLGEEGLNMVLNSRKNPQVRGCWKEISTAIPYRPYSAIYYRAQNLFSSSERRRWTQEEYDEIRKYQEEHGNEWKVLAEEFGRHRVHVKDTWRRIKLSGRKKGHWSQEEYQKLFNLVNVDLQAKLSEKKRSKHGMLRDNICWTAISDELSTRSQTNCCIKWYNQLSSSMVVEGIWADTDDYRLINALFSLDATCMEDVDWDCLVDGRSGDVCRERWNQMVLHIGQHGNKSFAEQVEVLAQRYCANLLAAREIWDSKPRVP